MKPIFLIIVMLLSVSLNAEEPFTHAGTGISLPTELFGLKQGSATTYKTENNSEGTAVPYHSEATEVTIFIRGYPNSQVPTAKDVLDESLGALKELEKNGLYSNLKVFGAQPDPRFPKWEKAAFMAKQKNGSPVVSFIYTTVLKQHSVKIRLTTNDPKNPNGMKFIEHIQTMIDGAPTK